jgi:hypothetical protein
LVHFGPWGNTINSKIKKLFGSNNVHNLINILIDVVALLLEITGLFDVLAFRIAAGMDKAIHIHVEVINVRV